jgi:hypothetical protein
LEFTDRSRKPMGMVDAFGAVDRITSIHGPISICFMSSTISFCDGIRFSANTIYSRTRPTISWGVKHIGSGGLYCRAAAPHGYRPYSSSTTLQCPTLDVQCCEIPNIWTDNTDDTKGSFWHSQGRFEDSKHLRYTQTLQTDRDATFLSSVHSFC